jgi:hypothetical protein
MTGLGKMAGVAQSEHFVFVAGLEFEAEIPAAEPRLSMNVGANVGQVTARDTEPSRRG